MNIHTCNPSLLSEEEKRLVRVMQRIRAGAGVVVLVGLVAAGIVTSAGSGPDHGVSPDSATRGDPPADPGLAAVERGPAG